VIGDLIPAALHNTGRYENNRVETSPSPPCCRAFCSGEGRWVRADRQGPLLIVGTLERRRRTGARPRPGIN